MQGLGGQFVLISWYDGLKETEMVTELFQGQDGSHATPSEISLTMHLRPEVFRGRKVFPQKDNVVPDYYWPLTAGEMRDVFSDGRMGAASWLASAEKGRLIMSVAVETLVEKIEKMRTIAIVD